MNHAFVVPRYGVEIVGGAEMAARMLAEREAEIAMLRAEVRRLAQPSPGAGESLGSQPSP